LKAKILITLPCISHGLFSAAIFSFLTSWDEVVLAIFMASPTLQTLPVKIWATLRQDLTPVIAAASTLLIVVTMLLMLIAAAVKKGMKAGRPSSRSAASASNMAPWSPCMTST
jgi:putative spermidine/putrescine transport system permease protein